MRIGIHTGPVLAGVIGSGRLAFDIWGETVNLASRMEQTAPIGQTQVTRAVVDAAGKTFRFVARGEQPIKGYGKVDTWLLDPEPLHDAGRRA